MTWNILHGGGARRLPEIALAVIEHAPDLVILTEFRKRMGGQLAGVLADHGLKHALTTDPADNINGVLIAAREPIERRLQEQPPAGFGHKWLAARLPGRGWDVLGVHIPDDSRPTEKAVFWQRLVAYARSNGERTGLIAGDFNTGRHYADEPGASFGCVTSLGQLCTLGYADAFRLVDPEGRDVTWKSWLGQGFRIDGVFVSGRLRTAVRSVMHSQAEREGRVSDHAPVLVELEEVEGEGGAGRTPIVENSQKSTEKGAGAGN